MANNLKKMKIREISLVDRPASPEADVILMKRDASAVQPSFIRKDWAAWDAQRAEEATGAGAAGGAVVATRAGRAALRATARGAVRAAPGVARGAVRAGRAVGQGAAAAAPVIGRAAAATGRGAVAAAPVVGRAAASAAGFTGRALAAFASAHPSGALGLGLGAAAGLGAYAAAHYNKRDVSDEPRDANGRWSTGAKVAAGVGAAAAIGAGAYFAGPHLAAAARSAYGAHRAVQGARNLSAFRAAMAAGTNIKPPPGLLARYAASAVAAGRKVGSALENNAGKITAAAAPAVTALAADTKLKSVKQIKGGLRLNGETKVGGVKSSGHFDVKPKQLLGLAGATTGATALKEGDAHPTNSQPIVTQRNAASNGAKIPLNKPGINPTKAGGWSYLTGNGKYIPAGSKDQQEFIEAHIGQPGYKLPTGSYATSGGQAYRTPHGDIVPGGSRDAQLNMESRYALERQRSSVSKCANLFSELSRPRLLPVVVRKKLFS